MWSNTLRYMTGARPYINDDAWEAMIVENLGEPSDIFDFWLINPQGRLYLNKALPDNFKPRCSHLERSTYLDFYLAILKVAESILVALSYIKVLDAQKEASIEMLFRWKGLKGRVLTRWSNPYGHMNPQGPAYQDAVTSRIIIPVDVATSDVTDYIVNVIAKLFRVFDGFEIDRAAVEEITGRLITRNL